MSSRTENSLKNVKITLFIYVLNILIQFISRTVFLKFLSVEYLGVNGLFTNILSMLNLAELGVGSAMAYALYKPCAEGDIDLVGQIMFLYKKLYQYIGLIVALLGLVVTPFLPYLIKDMPTGIGNIYIYFLLYVANTSLSYFFTYKRSLIVCNQKQYISTVTSFLKNVCICVFQIVFLYFTANYYIYLLIQVIFTVSENIAISKIADYQYPYLKEKRGYPDKELLGNIKKNVMAMSLHKIGGVVVNGTDNLIITKFVSLTATGLYSNYSIITTAITSVISQVFFALTASVGNLMAEGKSADSYSVFKRMFFLNFVIYLYAGTFLTILFNDIILVWLGNGYQLSMAVVVCIVMSFFSNGMRRTVLTFKDASGLFWNDRYKPIAESICNLVLSIPMTIYFGIAGTFLGTIITNVFVSGIIESWVLFKYGFSIPVSKYFIIQIKYYVNYSIALVSAYFLTVWIDYTPFVNLFLKIGVLLVFLSVMVICVYRRTDEFRYYTALLKMTLGRREWFVK